MGALSMDIVETLEVVLTGPRKRMHRCELVQRFLTGRLTRAHYIAFLTQTWHFVRFTPTHLRIAAARMPEGALRERFLKHAREEMGHDDWALADLEALGVAAGSAATPAANNEAGVPNQGQHQQQGRQGLPRAGS